MKAVPEADAAHLPVKEAKKASTFNIYPWLGMFLVIVAAAVLYGGLLLLLLEDWLWMQPVTPVTRK